jgi:hypothetical protein
VAQAVTVDDELITARCDLDWCNWYKQTLFDFDRYRRPEVYGPITELPGTQRRAVEPGIEGPQKERRGTETRATRSSTEGPDG